jgi:peptide deformylase
LIYDIVKYAEPVLRQKAKPIDEIDDAVKQLAQDMVETMHAAEGIGLAAQQIGETIAICVIDIPEGGDTDEEGNRYNPDVQMPLVLINPEVTATSEEVDSYEEGCLSFPDITGGVIRPTGATICYKDLDGQEQSVEATALLARCMLHEIDHLNGVLFIDRMSHVKRVSLGGRLKRLKKKTAGK